VPSAFVPFAVHVPGKEGEVQLTAPVRHGSGGWHELSAVHVGATQEPALHTFADPHGVQSALLAETTQLGSANTEAHVVVPVLHGFSGWHAWFATHAGAMHEPA
jgi:hypothetical protein